MLLAAIVIVVVLLARGSSTPVAKLPPIYPNRRGPEAMFTDGSLQTYAGPTLDQLKALGVDRAHVYMHWTDIAPDPTSSKRPVFDATNPAAYPASGWAPFDALVRALAARHMGIDVDLVPPPPNWAGGKGAPHPATQPEWKPSAAEFGQFVRAVATRYSGHYVPAGASKPLPRVGFWSIWNEPNFGIELAPEAIDHSQLEVAPRLYRAIVNAAWSAFTATGTGAT